MREFIHDNFLLHTGAARRLYHDFARPMPIFDYHCHLPVADIAANRGFGNLTQAWLAGDHYKWRAMRANGTAERLITGDASDAEKFAAWAETVPATIGNPLFHWTHLELRRYFGVRGFLDPGSADAIYESCSGTLRRDDFRVRGLLERMNVRVVCTTDDPADSLTDHERLRDDPSFSVTVLPGFPSEPGDGNRVSRRFQCVGGQARRIGERPCQGLRELSPGPQDAARLFPRARVQDL